MSTSTTQRSREEVIRRIEENDPTLTKLIVHLHDNCPHYQQNSWFAGDSIVVDNDELVALGKGTGANTHLNRFCFCGCGRELPDESTTKRFMEGFKRNTSIVTIFFDLINNFSQGLGLEILEVFRNNSTRLRLFLMDHCDLANGGEHEILTTLSACKKIEVIGTRGTGIDVGQLSLAIRRHKYLKCITLGGNNIGRGGCQGVATLLSDPESRVKFLGLSMIDNECITILANGLRNNNKLKCLDLSGNPGITKTGFQTLSQVLCNTSSINETYLSNHTLKQIDGQNHRVGITLDELRNLLELNSGRDKRKVAMIKIVRYHVHFNMEPFFEWDLKVLPIALKWFETARTIPEFSTDPNFDSKVLSVIYQFARVMPLFFVPTPPQKAGTKRKAGI